MFWDKKSTIEKCSGGETGMEMMEKGDACVEL